MPRSRSSRRLTGRSPASRRTRSTMSWRRRARFDGTRALSPVATARVPPRQKTRSFAGGLLSGNRRRAGGQLGERRVELVLAELGVLERACEVRVVRRQVEVAVPAEPEEDHPLLPGLARGLRLLDRRADRVGGLGRRDDALAAGELQRRRERLVLPVRARLDQP